MLCGLLSGQKQDHQTQRKKSHNAKHCLFSEVSFLFLDPNRVIHTEMMLVPEEFDNYQIGVDTDVTFCLKELRVYTEVVEFLTTG